MSLGEPVDERIAAECTRLVRESERRADQHRRTLPYAVQHALTVVAFGLAPLIPHASRIFGATSWKYGLVFVTPGLLSIIASQLLYRRSQCGYRIADTVEMLAGYVGSLAWCYQSGLTWPVTLVLPPFTAIFIARTKPFAWRSTLPLMMAAHAVHVTALIARGSFDAARSATVVGVVACVLLVALARQGIARLRLEADRNVMRARRDEALLQRERERLTDALTDGIGRELQALARALDTAKAPDGVVAQAHSAWSELDDMARRNSPAANESCSLEELAARIDQKCRPLCAGIQYDQTLRRDGDPSALIGTRAHALLRISQELVRNAVTHGRARTIALDLACDGAALVMRVRDDGIGISPEVFVNATGGLRNARRWVEEERGSLALEPSTGTKLRVTLPTSP